MNRGRKETGKTKGIYIAVCCCVSAAAIIGYVSRFALNDTKKVPENNSYVQENSELTEKLEIKSISNEPKEEKKRTVKPAEVKTAPAAKNVITEENVPSFIKPVKGDIIGKFSGDELVFHKTLADWRSHDGVDFKAGKGTEVVASADGIVEKVYSDSLGNCILIDHENGYKSLYANLEELNEDLTGKNVSQGESIGKAGTSALADLSEEAHLHFEIIKDDKCENPSEYIK